MPRHPLVPVAILIVFQSLGACGQAPPNPSAEAMDEVQRGDAAATQRGDAPVDDVAGLIGDIRTGIAPLPGRVGDDPEGARQRAVELYITRQERIEQAVGPGTASDAELAASVLEAEARFHELMQVLGTSPPTDSAGVAAAVSALDAELARVLDRVPSGATVVTEEAP